MARGRRGRRPSRAAPCDRVDVCGRLGGAFTRSEAGAARLDADRGRARHIGSACGGHGGTRPVDGSRFAANRGRRAACHPRGDSSVWPHRQAGTGRPHRTGALVLHDVHRARRRPDAGARADTALHGRRPGTGDHRLGLADAGGRGRRRSHGGDARRHRHGGHRGLQRL